MIRTMMTGFAVAALLGGAAYAETHEVLMLNRGDDGTVMVFEPGHLRIAPGDTIRFLATDKSHNTESIAGLVPEGAEPFKGRINEEVEVTLDAEGLYGVKCLPHYAMGMVMTIAVDDVAERPEDFLAGRIPPNAMDRFESQVEDLGL